MCIEALFHLFASSFDLCCNRFILLLKIATVLIHFAYRHKALTATALAALESKKDAEKAAALIALRTELKGEVDAAHRERDEHLENYAKVCYMRFNTTPLF